MRNSCRPCENADAESAQDRFADLCFGAGLYRWPRTAPSKDARCEERAARRSNLARTARLRPQAPQHHRGPRSGPWRPRPTYGMSAVIATSAARRRNLVRTDARTARLRPQAPQCHREARGAGRGDPGLPHAIPIAFPLIAHSPRTRRSRPRKPAPTQSPSLLNISDSALPRTPTRRARRSALLSKLTNVSAPAPCPISRQSPHRLNHRQLPSTQPASTISRSQTTERAEHSARIAMPISAASMCKCGGAPRRIRTALELSPQSDRPGGAARSPRSPAVHPR